MNLTDKLQKIQALIDKASSESERQAAELAKHPLQGRIKDNPTEFKIVNNSEWETTLFNAICKKHGLRTYRHPRQKYTTTMVRVNKSILDNVLWPEYQKYIALLQEMFDEIANDLIRKIYADDKEETAISGKISG